MSLEARISRLEAKSEHESPAVQGASIHAGIIDLLENHPEEIVALRTARMREDCDFTTKSIVDEHCSGGGR